MSEEVASSDLERHDAQVMLAQKRRDLDLQLAILTVLSLAMIIMGGLVVSHRVAGPIFHLRSYMRHRIDGAVPYREIRFRKNDFFGDLASLFNELQGRYASELEEPSSPSKTPDG